MYCFINQGIIFIIEKPCKKNAFRCSYNALLCCTRVFFRISKIFATFRLNFTFNEYDIVTLISTLIVIVTITTNYERINKIINKLQLFY